MPKFFTSAPPFSVGGAGLAAAPSVFNLQATAAPAAAALGDAAPAAAALAVDPRIAAIDRQTEVLRNVAVRREVVDVDVSATAAIANIIRDGREVTPPVLNPRRIDDFISGATVVGRQQLPVVVSQSVPRGTRVPRGTPVDLVLLNAGDVVFSLFDQFHADLATRPVTDLLPLVSDPTIAPLLDRDPTTLTDVEKGTITAAAAQRGVTINNADPTRTFDLALESFRDVRAFQ